MSAIYFGNGLFDCTLTDSIKWCRHCLPRHVGFEEPRAPPPGVFLWRLHMDRDEGFPPHIIGFIKRKREKAKREPAKPFGLAPVSDDQNRPASNA